MSKTEIITIEVEESFWWDLDRSQECGAPTGTPWSPVTRAEQRKRAVPKRVHKECMGDILRKFDTLWEGPIARTKFWDECSLCGQRFNETEYE